MQTTTALGQPFEPAAPLSTVEIDQAQEAVRTERAQLAAAHRRASIALGLNRNDAQAREDEQRLRNDLANLDAQGSGLDAARAELDRQADAVRDEADRKCREDAFHRADVCCAELDSLIAQTHLVWMMAGSVRSEMSEKAEEVQRHLQAALIGQSGRQADVPVMPLPLNGSTVHGAWENVFRDPCAREVTATGEMSENFRSILHKYGFRWEVNDTRRVLQDYRNRVLGAGTSSAVAPSERLPEGLQRMSERAKAMAAKLSEKSAKARA